MLEKELKLFLVMDLCVGNFVGQFWVARVVYLVNFGGSVNFIF